MTNNKIFKSELNLSILRNFTVSINLLRTLFCLIFLYSFINFLSCKVTANEIDKSKKDIHNLKLFKKTGFMMGSLIDISLYAENEKKSNKIIELAFEEVRRLDHLMSNYKKDSELSRINREAVRQATICDDELLYIIKQSSHYSKITKGAFDITVYPIVNLWGFFGDYDGNIAGYIPEENELQAILPAVSYKNIEIKDISKKNDTGSTIFFKNSKTQIDLGAIGKGYAVDKVIEILKSKGIKSALVNFAGNIFALGSPQGREKWNIGLKDPINTNNIIGSFGISNKAVATSGDYERFFVNDNKKYSHIIDPRNGKPVSYILSVTILSNSASMADALSTGIFVLGKNEGFELLQELNDVEGIIIFEGKESRVNVKISKGFEKILEVKREDSNSDSD